MKIFLIISMIFWSLILNSQLMINGGFELYDGSAPAGSDPYSIEYATGWHNLNNTCDLGHPNTASAAITPTPHTGSANARFGVPINGMYEFMYGNTLPLTIGTTYVVSFWVRKDYQTNNNLSVGLHIGSNQPTPQILNPYVQTNLPQIKIVPTSTQWERASFCYTTTESGPHYVTIGPFTNNGTGESQLYLIDDVSVEVLNNGGMNSQSNLTNSTPVACIENTVIIDGSSSLNETEYEWDVYNITSGSEVLVSNGTIQSGQAGQLNVSSLFSSIGHTPQKGNCYRVYLTTYNGCPDKNSIEFCYENPTINFLNYTNYLCEGVPNSLTVSGDISWTYTWSTGQSGVGLNTIQVNPSGNSATYSVNVLTSNNCSFTQSKYFYIYSSTNEAPGMNGINGSGEYTIYVNQGDIVNFTSNLFNDHSNENVTTSLVNSSIPSNFSTLILPNFPNNQTLGFNWNTGLGMAPDVDPGIYSFTFKSSDGNQCTLGENTFTFTIVVICDHCPMCVYYEDRGISPQTPLPSETNAGKCIEAGFSQSVSNSGANVLFQAGYSIDLGPFFTAEPGFVAQIEANTCVTDCEDCCTDWNGFTIDEIPMGYYMNFEDADPTNDIFQVTDVNHPFCAFGAKGYDLSILNAWGNVMAESSYSGSSCCPFTSPAPENQISNSSIWWDGLTDDIFGHRVHPNDGTYFYYLILYGCNGEEAEYQGFIHILSSSQMTVVPNDPTEIHSDQKEAITASLEALSIYNSTISLSPNPSSEEIQIQGIDGISFSAQLFDDKGLMIDKKLQVNNGKFNVSRLSPGTYFCKIMINGVLITKKFVKI